MRIATCALFLLCAAGLAPAQTIFTSPLGMDSIEGSGAFAYWGSDRRFQQVDWSLSGQVRLIRTFAVRRNGGSTTSGGAKTLDFSLDLGHVDFRVVSLDMDDNFKAGSRTTVFPQTTVNFPDWGTSVPGPAPFDFNISWAAPFPYNGTDALVIDFTCRNASPGNNASVDREIVNSGGGLSGATGSSLGTGCIATGQSSRFSHATRFMNMGPLPTPQWGFRFRISGDNAPANATGFLFIDYMDRQLAGLACTTLHASPIITIPVTADASGEILDRFYGFNYDQVLQGATLYTQLITLDPGQTPLPVSLSNACATTIPGLPAATCHRTCYSWLSLPGSRGVGLWFGGGMVIQLGL